MQLIITDSRFVKSQALQISGVKLVALALCASFVVMTLAVAMYHWVFLKGAREGWPVVSTLVRLVAKDEFAQRDRYMQENLDALARKVGEMQAKVMQLESLGARISSLAGVKYSEPQPTSAQGGALVASRAMSVDELQDATDSLDRLTGDRMSLWTALESKLMDRRIGTLMLPTQKPVDHGILGSPFGWRIDPFTGRSALHTGLDFQAQQGTAILAAAGGVVVTQEYNSSYGNMIEVDHGNDLITRYAHASKTFVKKGDLIKRGQKIAEVGSTGRSTGPHLHFEVLVGGTAQDPQKFLLAARGLAPMPTTTVPLPAGESSHAINVQEHRTLVGQR